MAHGGARPGSGPKPKAESEKTSQLCKDAIAGKYGDPISGLKALLDSKEPMLIRFVFEHAYGKPVEKAEHSGGISITAFWDKTLLPSTDTPALPQE